MPAQAERMKGRAPLRPDNLIRCFNEDESVWRAFEKKRKRLRLFRLPFKVSEEDLDRLVLALAECECRMVWCVGREAS